MVFKCKLCNQVASSLSHCINHTGRSSAKFQNPCPSCAHIYLRFWAPAITGNYYGWHLNIAAIEIMFGKLFVQLVTKLAWLGTFPSSFFL